MESKNKRILQSGKEFEELFPRAKLQETIVKRNGTLEETITLIKKVIAKDQNDTAKIAILLKGNSLQETTQKIWNFVYRHIQYIKDKPNVEEIRRPARLWHDRQTGGDCDCMSVFIGTILSNLNIPFTLRIAEYDAGYYQHIYPIVIKDNRFYTEQGGRENRQYYIVIDCVKDQFDAEHPYRKIKDYDILRSNAVNQKHTSKNMDLAYLSGLENTDSFEGMDATPEIISQMEGLGILNDYAVDALGKIKKTKRNANAQATQNQATANPNATKAEVKRFYIRKTHIYRLNDGTIIKMGRFVRQPGERTILFKAPNQSNFIESGVLHQAHFFVDNNDTAWGIATVNNSYWRKLPTTGWQQTVAYEYNQAIQNRKTPVPLRGYVLKDGTRIFLNKNAPRYPSGYPVRWKRAEEESESNTSPWISNGLLSAMYIAENQEFVIGKNGEGNFYKSIGFAQWNQITEDEYFQLKQKALKGLNELGSLLSINGAEELTLNSTPETKGLFIPYDVLEKLFSKRLDPQTKSYQGIAGLGYLLGDNLLDAIEPVIENIANIDGFEGQENTSDALSGEDEVAGIFGETEILGIDGYYENIGDLAELSAYPETELQGNDSLFLADGLGRVRRRRAKRGGGGKETKAEATKGPQRIGMYIPVQVLQQLLKFRNDNLIRLQNKGIEITRGTIPATISGTHSINGFFDVIAAPFKAVAKVAKFLPIPGVSTVANLVDSATSNSSVPQSAAFAQVTKMAREAIEKLQNQINQHNAIQSQNAAEAVQAYDANSVKGLDGIGSTAMTWIKENPVKTALVGAGLAWGGYALYQNQSKSKLNGFKEKRKGKKEKSKSKSKKLEVIKL